MRRGLSLLLAAPGAALLVFFFLIPLVAVSADGFAGGGNAFLRVFRNDLFWGGLRGTLLLAATASIFSLAVGFMVALHLSRLGEAARTVLVFFIALPLTFSGLIVAYGSSFRTAALDSSRKSSRSLASIPQPSLSSSIRRRWLAFASSYYLIPRVVMLLLPVLVNFDKAQFVAAESLGATRAQTIRDVLIPQILPTAFTAFCLVAAVAMGAYGTALALVGTQVNILLLQLFSMISETGSDFPAAAALSLLLMAMCSCVIAVGEVVAARREEHHAQAR